MDLSMIFSRKLMIDIGLWWHGKKGGGHKVGNWGDVINEWPPAKYTLLPSLEYNKDKEGKYNYFDWEGVQVNWQLYMINPQSSEILY